MRKIDFYGYQDAFRNVVNGSTNIYSPCRPWRKKSRGWVFGLASFLEVTSELKTILAPWLKWGLNPSNLPPLPHPISSSSSSGRIQHCQSLVFAAGSGWTARRECGKTQYSVEHHRLGTNLLQRLILLWASPMPIHIGRPVSYRQSMEVQVFP